MMPLKENLTPKQRRQWEQWLSFCRRLAEQGDTLTQETEEGKKRRIETLLDPLHMEAFIQYYFGSSDFKPASLAWFHHRAIENLFVKNHRLHVWEWYRESGKSIFADLFVPIYMIARGELNGMILASENGDKANNLLKDIEAHLRHNRRLIADFGPFDITGSWLNGFFQTGNGIGFWAFGLGQNPAGVRAGFKRPNLGIVDDADNKDKARNEKLTLERLEWIRGEFMGCLAKDNRRFIYLNNRVHPRGLTARIVGDIEPDQVPHPTIAHVKTYLTEDAHHGPIYPEGTDEKQILRSLRKQKALPSWDYYSLEDCAKKIADMGLRDALRQCYHRHEEKGTWFTDAMMPWVDPLPLEAYEALTSYCDPAFGEGGKGSYKAIVLVGLVGAVYTVLYVYLRQQGDWVAAHRRLALHPERIEGITAGYGRWPAVREATTHWVEANPLQKTELDKTYELMNLAEGVPWYPRYDTEKKAEKVGRIETLIPLAAHGKITFNKKLIKNPDMIALRDQLKAFPEGHLDGPDALVGALDKTHRSYRNSGPAYILGKYTKPPSSWLT